MKLPIQSNQYDRSAEQQRSGLIERELTRLETLISALNDRVKWGTGTPESAVPAKIGTAFLRLDGGANTTLYVKESGDGTNTGWIAK